MALAAFLKLDIVLNHHLRDIVRHIELLPGNLYNAGIDLFVRSRRIEPL